MGRPHLCVACAARAVRDLSGPRRPEAGRCQQSRCASNFGNHLKHSRMVRAAQGENVSPLPTPATTPSPRWIPTVSFQFALFLVAADSFAVLFFLIAGLLSIAHFSVGAYLAE